MDESLCPKCGRVFDLNIGLQDSDNEYVCQDCFSDQSEEDEDIEFEEVNDD